MEEDLFYNVPEEDRLQDERDTQLKSKSSTSPDHYEEFVGKNSFLDEEFSEIQGKNFQ